MSHNVDHNVTLIRYNASSIAEAGGELRHADGDADADALDVCLCLGIASNYSVIRVANSE